MGIRLLDRLFKGNAQGVGVDQKGIWLPITEYSEYREISISTIRRYIKAGQVTSKKENGKYLIFVSEENRERKSINKEKEDLKLKLELEELRQKMRILEEENNDLKMLVHLYENNKSEKKTALPPTPTSL